VQNISATNPFDGVPLATHFSRNGSATLSNRSRYFLAQVEIAADAFIVGTLEAKHGLGVVEIDLVFELAALLEGIGIVVFKYCRERFQPWELIRKAGRLLNALFLLFLILRSRSRWS
jgi:hypothetical protein